MRTIHAVPFLVAVLTAAAAAQVASPIAKGPASVAVAPLGPSVIPIHTAPDDPVGGAYGVWAAGGTYKVSFHGAPTFIPYLGAEYPRNQPVTFHTRSVRIGEQELLDAEEPPARWHDDRRYEYRYPHVTERYDVRLDGLEQSFVVHERPAATGDLVVEIEVDSRLRAEPFADQHRAVRFCDERGDDILDYGVAFAIDAAGRRCEMTTTWADGSLRLRAPAAWLSSATFPVVVDPLTSVWIDSYGTPPLPSVGTGIARDDRSNRILTAMTVYASSGDRDVIARSFTDGFGNAPAGNLVFTDLNTWSSHSASCANVGPAAADKWVIALVREVPSAVLRCWVAPANITTLRTTVIAMPYLSTRQDTAPKVGGIEAYDQSGSNAAGGHALVVFQRNNTSTVGSNELRTEVWGALVDCTTTAGAIGTPFRISFGPVGTLVDPDAEEPAITAVSEGAIGSNPASWVVVYRWYNLAAPTSSWTLRARRIDATGAVSSSFWSPTNAQPGIRHLLAPTIAGQRGRYMVASPHRTPGTGGHAAGYTNSAGNGSSRFETERFDWVVGGSIQRHAPEVTLLPAASGANWLECRSLSLDTDTDSQYLLTAVYNTLGPFYIRLGARGIPLEYVAYGFGGLSPSWPFPPGVYDDDGKRFLAVEFGGAGGPGSRGAIITFAAESPWATYGTSCSPAVIAWQARDAFGHAFTANDQQIGNEFNYITMDGAPAGQLSILLMAFQALNGIDLGSYGLTGCQLLVPPQGSPGNLGAAGTVTSGTGHAEVKLSLPEFLNPGTLAFQWFHVAPGANPAGMQSTRRLEVPIVK